MMLKIVDKVNFGIVDEEFFLELMADSNLGFRDLVKVKVSIEIDTKIKDTKNTSLLT